MKVSVFSSSVTIRERINLGDFVLTVKLVDRHGEVLAATALKGSGVPMDFDLTVDPALMQGAEHVRFWAMLRSSQGTWGTLELSRFDPEVVLSRVDT